MPNHLTNKERVEKWLSAVPKGSEFRSADIAKALDLSTSEAMGMLRQLQTVKKIPATGSRRGIWRKVSA